jgi:hypothetical protein
VSLPVPIFMSLFGAACPIGSQVHEDSGATGLGASAPNLFCHFELLFLALEFSFIKLNFLPVLRSGFLARLGYFLLGE